MTKEEHIEEIEKLLRFHYEASIQGSINLAPKEVIQDFQIRLAEIDYHHFINSADQHYFIARQLFIRHIGEYAYFCAHQSVENYLKALFRFLELKPPKTHKLEGLIDKLKEHTSKEEYNFIHSLEIKIIALTYEPYYEYARYPVQSIRPKDGKYFMMFPDGIETLDLFVYRMREILTIPEGNWNLLIDGLQSLESCQRNFPDFYETFKHRNINFE